jgi:hypothetical protein
MVAVGQLALGVVWSAGMVGVGATSGPGLVFGAFGRLYVLGVRARSRLGVRARSQLGVRAPSRLGRRLVTPPALSGTRVAVGLVITVAIVALWWVGAGKWLLHDLTRPGGILVDPPHVLR